jgi:alkyl hydroperoxide reductase subunit AhpF
MYYPPGIYHEGWKQGLFMEKFMSENFQKQVMAFLDGMTSSVAIILFTSKVQSCDYCLEAQQLLTELSELSSKLSFTMVDLEENPEMANRYHIDKVPGIVIARIVGDNIVDFGVKYYGIPAGHEFGAFVNSILLVSSGETKLSLETRDFLVKLKEPVHLMVFSTPT